MGISKVGVTGRRESPSFMSWELAAILYLAAYSFEYFPLDCLQPHIVYSLKYGVQSTECEVQSTPFVSLRAE